MMSHTERLSVETSAIMDNLGYGSELRQARRNCYRENDRLMSKQARDMATWITTGSMAEGLTYFFDGQRNIIVVINDVLCIEEGVAVSTLPSDIAVLILSNNMCYHGYCRLQLEKHGMKMPTVFYNALCDDGYGRILLSSELLLDGYSTFDIEQYQTRAGPALPRYSSIVTYRMDPIVSIRCHCPDILQRWAARARHWPPPDTVQKVVSLGAFVTPVGFNLSDYKHIEWRICFYAGESELVSNLNDTQIKVYIMLKMIIREIVKPPKKEITSFGLKSIVLWLAENNPQSLFHERTLYHWLCEGLAAIRTALDTKHLPYYMIPDRNLMAACGLKDEQQRSWVSTITDMISEGPRVILRLKSFRQAIISHPEPLRWYSRKRTELELLMLMYMNRRLLCSDELGMPDETDVMLQVISRRQTEIVQEVVMRMYLEGRIVYDLHDVLFRMLDRSNFS